MSGDAKKFTSFDKGINLVSKPSDLDEYDDDPDVLRAVLSCGHITDPETLTDCCRAQLDDGKTEFKCPLCEKKWPYDEVRKLAKLSDDETLIFEDKVGTNTVKKLVDFRGVSSLFFFCDLKTDIIKFIQILHIMVLSFHAAQSDRSS